MPGQLWQNLYGLEESSGGKRSERQGMGQAVVKRSTLNDSLPWILVTCLVYRFSTALFQKMALGLCSGLDEEGDG